MPDYTFDPSPAEIAEATAFVNSTLQDSVVWQSVTYAPDGRGGTTITHTDTTIPVWVRNPGQKDASATHAPGEIMTEWEFVCRKSDNVQPKDIFVYNGLAVEVVEIILKGTSSFSQIIFGKRVSS